MCKCYFSNAFQIARLAFPSKIKGGRKGVANFDLFYFVIDESARALIVAIVLLPGNLVSCFFLSLRELKLWGRSAKGEKIVA